MTRRPSAPGPAGPALWACLTLFGALPAQADGRDGTGHHVVSERQALGFGAILGSTGFGVAWLLARATEERRRSAQGGPGGHVG